MFSGKHAVDSIGIGDNIFIHGSVLGLGLDVSFLFLKCKGGGDFLLFKVFCLAEGFADRLAFL